LLPPAPPPTFQHPWKTSLRWYEKGEGLKNYKGEEIEGFGCSVNPGLVNGLDPVAIGAWSDSSNLADVPSQGDYRRAPGLLDFPIVPIPATSFVAVSKPMPSGYPPVSIPLGLRDLGVKAVSGAATGASPDSINIGNLDASESDAKYCAVAWLYLRAARPSVMAKGDVDQSNGFFDGVKYYTKYGMENLSRWGGRAQLMVGVPPENPPPRTSMQESVTDLGFDFHPLIEIFLVSGQEPRKDDRGNVIIDGGWIPFVRHHCFWNLEYRFDASHLGKPMPQFGNLALPFVGLIGRYGLAPIATGAALVSMTNSAIAGSIKGVMGRWWT
jgi:hypothetical protein